MPQASQPSVPDHIPPSTTAGSADADGFGEPSDRTHRGSTQRRTSLLTTLVLGGLTALPPLSTDMYLPALPKVTEALHSFPSATQLTLTACIIGLALGQLVVGPMSDRWGRRRPLLGGLLVYVMATAICALAPTVELLIGFRLLQGLAGAAGIVIARAVVRDLYDGVEMSRFFSTLTAISGAAPILGPVLGGQLLRFTDWRGVFVALAVLGLLLVLAVWRWLDETLPADQRHDGGVRRALRTMGGLFADRIFTGYLLTGAFGFAALFTYVSGSSFVVQGVYGASAQTYSLLFALNSMGFIVVSQLNGKVLVGRFRTGSLMAVGLGLMTVAATVLLTMASGVLGEVGLVPMAAGLLVLSSAMGLTQPNANSLAMSRTGHAAGSASALLGSSFFLMGAVASPLAGIAGEDTAVPMTAVQLVCAFAAVACFVGLCRPWQPSGS
ncbi:multidrug effflux MFS transporter [Streptomyces sp. NPDC050619]|uniref:multidrug effflux MFS transporter n=1 Tax=Streptomyces sp. NPDC050619 TaxID=3157214 RepID=UPI0034436690